MNASLLLDPVLMALAGIFVKAAVLVAIAVLVTQTMRWRRLSASSLHLVWTMTTASLLVLPLLELRLPRWGVGVATIPSLATTSMAAAGAAAPQNDAAWFPAAITNESGFGPGAIEVLFALYLLGAVAFLFRIALGNWRVAKLAKRSSRVSDHEWRALLLDLGPVMDVQRNVHLLHSSEIDIPMTWGMRRPVILLPIGAGGWPAERRRAVLLHELAHVTRFDCLTQLLATVTCAFYWFHPAVWYAARMLRMERERACDDQVLKAGMKPRVYAIELFEVAQAYRPRAMAAIAALGMAHPSELEDRMVALMDRFRSRDTLSRRSVAAATLGAIAVTIPLACLQPRVIVGESQTPVKIEALAQSKSAASSQFTNVEISGNRIADNEAVHAVVGSDSSCRGINQTYFAFQVDRQAEFIFDSTVAVFPNPTRPQNGVAVQFVVDQRGQPEVGSFKVLRAADDAVPARVREVFPQWRFTPALRQGCAVRQLVQVEVLVPLSRYQAIP